MRARERRGERGRNRKRKKEKEIISKYHREGLSCDPRDYMDNPGQSIRG